MENIINSIDGTIDYNIHNVLSSRILQRRLEHLAYLRLINERNNEGQSQDCQTHLSRENNYEMQELLRISHEISAWNCGTVLTKESHFKEHCSIHDDPSIKYSPIRFMNTLYFYYNY